MARRQAGIQRRLVSVVLEDAEPVLWGREPVYRDGICVGYTTSGAYGHALGASVGLAYVGGAERLPKGWIKGGAFEIEVGGARTPAQVSLRAPYDPGRARAALISAPRRGALRARR